MSIKALNWAFEQQIEPVTKLVLIALADCAGDTMYLFPSIKHLCDKTSLHRTTVMEHLTKLIEAGIIEDTGKKVGRSNQIRILRIVFTGSPERPVVTADRSAPTTGTGRPGRHVPVAPADTEPSLENHQITSERAREANISPDAGSPARSETRSPATVEEWERRVKGFNPSVASTWPANWGPSPDSPLGSFCLMPKDLRARWHEERRRQLAERHKTERSTG